MRVSLQLRVFFVVAEMMPEGTENPCVHGSIPPPGTTSKPASGKGLWASNSLKNQP